MKNKSKQLTIAFFTDTYLPQMNGVVISIESFRKELERRGHRVYVFAPSSDVKSHRQGNLFLFPSTPYYFQPEYRFAAPMSKHLLKEFIGLNIDIVHTQTPISLGISGSWFARAKGVPLVYTYHTDYTEYIKLYFAKKLMPSTKMLEKGNAYFCNRCDTVIAPSVKIKNLLIGYGVTRPINVIMTGLELSKFKKDKKVDIRREYKIPASARVLTCIARLGKEKNVAFLLKSFAEAIKSKKNLYLFLISGGPDQEKLQKLSALLGIEKRVIFAGYLDNSKVIQVLYASDLFVFSSKTETQGIVVAEAAACGLPVVIVNDPAFSQIAIHNENALVVPEKTSAFSAAIVSLLNDKKLYNKFSTNSKRLASELTIQNETDKLVELYAKSIAKMGRPSKLRMLLTRMSKIKNIMYDKKK